MKTTIEINGFEIVISEQEGAVVVSAIKEDETIEEFTLEVEDAQGQSQSQDIQDFAQEENDFAQAAQDVQDQAQELQDQAQAIQGDQDEIKLESFEAFMNKRK